MGSKEGSEKSWTDAFEPTTKKKLGRIQWIVPPDDTMRLSLESGGKRTRHTPTATLEADNGDRFHVFYLDGVFRLLYQNTKGQRGFIDQWPPEAILAASEELPPIKKTYKDELRSKIGLDKMLWAAHDAWTEENKNGRSERVLEEQGVLEPSGEDTEGPDGGEGES